MKQTNKPVDESRRNFISSAAVAGVGGALAAAVPASTALAAAGEADAARKKTKGYRLTQHILDYYKSAAS
ncbi:MAG: transcriptional initiation protein Tat [Gammaproteobacteria bacterium]|nr:transcriptional initiation protein Tat [Gammaproteobacteria bacterium]MCB1903530.1 transcriptional initiation protein Tat [Gammaproteobacteria bacterium]